MSKNSRIQTFFSKCTWNVLQNRSHVKRIKIIPSIFSNHNNMKLEVNYRKENGKRTHTRRLNDMLLKKQWVNREIKKEIRKYLETNKNGNMTLQKSMWCGKNRSKREVYSDTGLPYLVAQTVKVSAYNVGDQGLIPGPGRSSGEGSGNPLQYSCLENPMDGGAW